MERPHNAFEFLYERLVLAGDSQENWSTALAELGLTLVTEEVN